MKFKTAIISILLLLLIVSPCYADPVINTITAGQKKGQSINIEGTGFGNIQGSGYVRFCGLKEDTVSLWSDILVTVTIPDNAHSGYIVVVDNGGKESDGYWYEINYLDGIAHTFKTSDPDTFAIKDIGYFTCASLIEAETDYLYVHTFPMLSTFDITTTPPTMLSTFALPSKAVDMDIFGDYLFVTGGFGLEIYKTSDLQAGGFRTLDPPITAGFTGIRARTVHVATFSGIPISGVGVALFEMTGGTTDPTIYFFEWDTATETLDYITSYTDSVNMANKLIFGGVLWPHATTPKMEVAECQSNTGTNCNIREYILGSNFSPVTYNGAVNMVTAEALEIGDMKISDNRIWVSLLGTVNSDYDAFWALDVSAGSLISKTTYIKACSTYLSEGVDQWEPCDDASDCTFSIITVCENGWCMYADKCEVEQDCQFWATWADCDMDTGWCQSQCVNDSDCNPPLFGNRCLWPGGGGDCVCGPNNYCQQCRTDTSKGYLDIIPDDNLVVGITGMSTDYKNRHNVFIWDLNAGATDHWPLASGETTDWAFDVAGISGKIVVADEWTNVELFDYTTSPYLIEQTIDPTFKETSNRIFSTGWTISAQWPIIHNGRVYYGEMDLMGAEMYDLGDFSSWYHCNQDLQYPYSPTSGDGDGNYLFVKGAMENFLTVNLGAWLQLYYVDPISDEMKMLNDPEDNEYLSSYSNACHGETLWWDTNVVVSALGTEGIFAFYVDPEIIPGPVCTIDGDCAAGVCIDGSCQYGEIVVKDSYDDIYIDYEIIGTAWRSSNWSELEAVDSDTVASGRYWYEWSIPPFIVPPYPVDRTWGGVYFFDISYVDPEVAITISQASPANVNFTLGSETENVEAKGIRSLDVLEIDGDLWFVASIEVKRNVADIEWYVIIFKYDDIATLNTTCLHPEDPGYNASVAAICEAQFEARAIHLDPAYSQFDPTPYMGKHTDASWWVLDGEPLVAVAVFKGYGYTDPQYKAGIWVFDVNDGSSPSFDIDNIADPNVYYIPAEGNPQRDPSYAYELHEDINNPMICDPVRITRLENGDLLVFGVGVTCIRVGDPDICAIDADCDDSDECTSDTCTAGVCGYVIDKDTDTDSYIDDNCSGGTDCDDTDADVNPGETEGPNGDPTCIDGKDNDCDGNVDAADSGCVEACNDNDSDGYGDPASPFCINPELDCDDTDANINPGATEGPNGDPTCSDTKDNDCDGDVDASDAGCQPVAAPHKIIVIIGD